METLILIPNIILYFIVLILIAYYLYDSFISKNHYNIANLSIICIIFFCVYVIGYKSSRSELNKEIVQLQSNIQLLKNQHKQIEKQIVVQYVDKIKTVKDIQYVVQTKIKEKSVRIDSECKIDPEVPLIINAAALNNVSSLQ